MIIWWIITATGTVRVDIVGMTGRIDTIGMTCRIDTTYTIDRTEQIVPTHITIKMPLRTTRMTMMRRRNLSAKYSDHAEYPDHAK